MPVALYYLFLSILEQKYLYKNILNSTDFKVRKCAIWEYVCLVGESQRDKKNKIKVLIKVTLP